MSLWYVSRDNHQVNVIFSSLCRVSLSFDDDIFLKLASNRVSLARWLSCWTSGVQLLIKSSEKSGFEFSNGIDSSVSIFDFLDNFHTYCHVMITIDSKLSSNILLLYIESLKLTRVMFYSFRVLILVFSLYSYATFCWIFNLFLQEFCMLSSIKGFT